MTTYGKGRENVHHLQLTATSAFVQWSKLWASCEPKNSERKTVWDCNRDPALLSTSAPVPATEVVKCTLLYFKAPCLCSLIRFTNQQSHFVFQTWLLNSQRAKRIKCGSSKCYFLSKYTRLKDDCEKLRRKENQSMSFRLKQVFYA